VRSLVDQLGGTLTFTNSLDPQGTLVALTVPDQEQRLLTAPYLSPAPRIDTMTSEVTS
jgi:hypothetical protein